jgi:thiopeptide-type bacteriocin biosynthesis protein
MTKSNKQATIASTHRKIAGQKPVAKRTFLPGSEWLYLKCYCSTRTTDAILIDAIRPLADHLLAQQLINSWFFIRYKDQHAHLRVRFHLSNEAHYNLVLDHCNQYLHRFISGDAVWKIQIDTYDREVERYEDDFILPSEQLFFHDSVAVVDFLEAIREDPEKEEVRWLWGLRAVDQLLKDFSFSSEDKLSLLEKMKNSFAAEFKLKKTGEMALDRKFRKYRVEIERMLNKNSTGPYHSILENKSERVMPIIEPIINTYRQRGIVGFSIHSFLESHIHMMINRIVAHSPRLHEMIIYDFMYRHYSSEKARSASLHGVNEK